MKNCLIQSNPYSLQKSVVMLHALVAVGKNLKNVADECIL
ncbi:hypothetical protein D1AOALGA4SA_8521 [Olavius algarvensis Delta 1 endosymbiont]|nr:hypothetical protein D1AOALGA4SA_8521 [Olavius algarvensis Delta 1 endosymbiont]